MCFDQNWGLDLIYISLEFRWLWAAQSKSRFPTFKHFLCLFFYDRSGQLTRIKQFCESGLSCNVEMDKQNKIRAMYYSKLISTSNNLFEKRNLENCFQFNQFNNVKVSRLFLSFTTGLVWKAVIFIYFLKMYIYTEWNNHPV